MFSGDDDDEEAGSTGDRERESPLHAVERRPQEGEFGDLSGSEEEGMLQQGLLNCKSCFTSINP